MSVPRTDRLNAEFQKNIYEILKNKVKDPRITEMFSVTKVETDKELSFAKVYISIFSKDKAKTDETMEAIVRSAGFARRELSKEMRIRTVPQLIFVKDDSMEYSDKIDKIINEINKNQ
ncbi:MAG: 30S ribosome-binding factor RbfA [Clostridia bacterium]